MATELENTLGGVYSLLSQEFQLPLINRIVAVMTKAKRLPSLPKKFVKPAIVTGLEALGRGHDLTRLQTFQAAALQALGPELVQKYMNPGDFLMRLAAATGINTNGLIKTAEQIQAEQQQAQQMAMMQQGIAPAINALGRMGVQAQADGAAAAMAGADAAQAQEPPAPQPEGQA
jgi:hypothetical protein